MYNVIEPCIKCFWMELTASFAVVPIRPCEIVRVFTSLKTITFLMVADCNKFATFKF